MESVYSRLPRSVGAYEDARAQVIADLLQSMGYLWPRNRPMDPVEWFTRYAAVYDRTVFMAQLEAAVLASWSVDNALREQQVRLDPAAPEVDPAEFAGVDGSGRPVMGQAYATAGRVGGTVEGAALAGGNTAVALSDAWSAAGTSLMVATQTIISDTSRSVKSAKMLARDTGWVRVLTPPSCSRCAVLAGKYHRNATADFNRHPGCDCTQMPVKQRDSLEFRAAFTDPRDYFESLDPHEQDKIFTKTGAQAIRDGADVGQVVNARRGMGTVTDQFGYRTRVSTEGSTVRGWASRYLRQNYDTQMRKVRGSRYRSTVRARLMPEEIYKIADGDRDIAMSLLHKNGFYTDASPRLTSEFSWYVRDEDIRIATERARQKLRARGVTPRN